jgi:hypothetical protein
LLRCMSPLMAQSRHPDRVGEFPLSGVKRTSQLTGKMSAYDPKRTSWGLTTEIRMSFVLTPSFALINGTDPLRTLL